MNIEMCIEQLNTLAEKYNKSYSAVTRLWVASGLMNFIKFENVLLKRMS